MGVAAPYPGDVEGDVGVGDYRPEELLDQLRIERSAPCSTGLLG